jgi:hypothetical protein
LRYLTCVATPLMSHTCWDHTTHLSSPGLGLRMLLEPKIMKFLRHLTYVVTPLVTHKAYNSDYYTYIFRHNAIMNVILWIQHYLKSNTHTFFLAEYSSKDTRTFFVAIFKVPHTCIFEASNIRCHVSNVTHMLRPEIFSGPQQVCKSS